MKKVKTKTLLIFIIALCIVIGGTGLVLVLTKNPKPDLHTQYTLQKIQQYEQENITLKSVDAVFIGDSWTDGYDIANSYPEYKCLNRGIGGDRTQHVLDRLKVSVYDISPKVVVLLIGGNDMLAGKSNDYILDNVQKIVVNIKQNLPNTKIIMQSYYHLTFDYANFNQTLIELSNGVKEISDRYNLTYIEIYPHLIDVNTNQLNTEYAIEDGVHINQKGYEVITSLIKPTLYNLINS